MADVADLSDIGVLYQELRNIRNGFGNLDAGGRLIAVMISGGTAEPWQPEQGGRPPPMRQVVTLNTEYMEYPPAMVEAIKGFMTAREGQILARLAELGVTNNDGR